MTENSSEKLASGENCAAEPVKLKMYGLFWMTQRGYLLVQLGLLLTLLLLLAAFYWVLPSTAPMVGLVRKAARWVLVLVVVGELGETFVVLRKFKAKRRAARAVESVPVAVAEDLP